MNKLLFILAMIVSTVTFSQEDPDNVVKYPTTVAEFKGGPERMNRYIATYIKYPREAKEKQISGTVYVGFVVTKKGKIQDVKVERSVHPLLDKEAVHVVEKMPKWKAARLNGRKVASKCLIPVAFRLKQ